MGVPDERRKGRWLRRALVAVVALVVLAGLFVAALPWLARPLLVGALTAALRRPVSIAALRWDTSAGSVVADDLAVGSPPDRVTARRVAVVVDVRASDRQHLVIGRVDIEAPAGAVALDEQFRPRLGDGDGGGLGAPSLPVAVTVRELVVSDAAIAVRPPVALAGAVAVAITSATATDVELDSDGGLRLGGEWRGTVDGAAMTGTGTLRLATDEQRVAATLSVAKLRVRDGMAPLPAPLASLSGTLDATARVAIGDPPAAAEVQLDLRLAKARIAGPPGLDLRAANIALPAARVDLAARRVDLGPVAVQEPVVSLDLARAAAAPPPSGEEAAWSLRSGPVTVRGGELRLRRGEAAAAARLERVRWDGLRDTATPLALSARAADGGTLSVSGPVRAAPLSAELEVRADGLVLPPWARLLDLPVALARGTGSGTARLVYRDGLRSAAGDVRLSDLHTLPPDPARPTEVLAVADAAGAFTYTPGEPATIEVPSLSLGYPYAMVVHGAAGTFPYSVLAGDERGAGAASPELRIGRLDLVGGKVELVDETLQPAFWSSLTGATGSAEGVALPAWTIERFAVAGKRDEISPVAVSGTVTAHGVGGRAELTDVLLDSLNAYVAPRLGYRITAGRLSTVATAMPEPPLLVSTADLVLQGVDVEQTGTDVILAQSGVPLPIALGLISGPGGRIDLTLPFSVDTRSGDVTIGSVVWQAVRKAILTALTSPLRILGSLFGTGGAPHAFAVEPIPFATGSATLDAAGRARVAEIARIVQAHAGLLVVLLPQVSDADLDAVGSGGAAALARARGAAAREAFVDGDDGPALPAARLLLAPWEPAKGAKATNRPGVYVELQDAG